MSYYTGSVNSFQELRTVLLNACEQQGWTVSGNILSKGTFFAEVTASVINTGAGGLIVKAGTGASGGALTGANGAAAARLGRTCNSGNMSDVAWPATYHIFIFSNPAEVYVVLNFSITRHYWLAMGQSDIPGLEGTGNWFAGCSAPDYNSTGGYHITESKGVTSHQYSSGPFWFDGAEGTLSRTACGIHTGFDGVAWTSGKAAGVTGYCTALGPLQGLPMGPSPWNGEAPLLPISVTVLRPSSKVSLALQMRNARFVRIDNYVPGQVITLGHDKWMIFPFGVKNAAAPNGVQGGAHTGTFGWALRYEG